MTGLRDTMNIYMTGILFDRGQWFIDFHFGEDRFRILERGHILHKRKSFENYNLLMIVYTALRILCTVVPLISKLL